jgi:hypothetical protein
MVHCPQTSLAVWEVPKLPTMRPRMTSTLSCRVVFMRKYISLLLGYRKHMSFYSSPTHSLAMGFFKSGTHVIIVPPSDFFQPPASSETILSFKKVFNMFYF